MSKSLSRSLPIALIALFTGTSLASAAPLSLQTPAIVENTANPANPGLVRVNVIDRLLRDAGVRQHGSSSQGRTRSSKGRQASQSAPQPPALSNVPVPLPKPDQQTATAAAPPAEELKTTHPPKAPEIAAADKVPTPQAAPPAEPAETPPVVEQPATATEPARQAEVPKPESKPEAPVVSGNDSEKPAKPALEPTSGKAETTSPEGKAAKDGATADQKPAPDDGKPDGAKPDADKATGENAEGEKAQEDKADASPPPPPLVKEDPEELKACLADLAAIGAKFEPTDPIDDGNGCGIEHPIDVAEVLPGVALGGATMRCKTALTMAHWLKDTVQPAMTIAMPGRRIVGLVPGSTYQCRLRNSAATGKISEHARGNAYDVAAFKLDNGERMEMKPRTEDSTMEGAFQRTATAGACLHFTTVLSPGSDAAHETHLHLDVLERKGGYRYCR